MKKGILFLAAAVLAYGLAGCARAERNVSTDGSTSMERVIGALGEAFTNENSGVTFTYNPTGSGAGITAVAEGRCDIGLSSRELTEGEKEKGLKVTVLAYDGIAVIVNPENPVTDLPLDILAQIYTGEITNWKTVGGRDGRIVPIGREANSGTREGFESVTQTKGKCQYRQELTATGDVIATVAANPNAIGYTSVASVKDTVKTLTIGKVAPTANAIRDGSYKIRRPFLLVTAGELCGTVRDFLDFCLTENAKRILTAMGVVPAG